MSYGNDRHLNNLYLKLFNNILTIAFVGLHDKYIQE